jgi:NAD(P)-dependent dehydrogenase (short-subunit alcohol dehydrogenase family)
LGTIATIVPEDQLFRLDANDLLAVQETGRQICQLIPSWDALFLCPCTSLPVEEFFLSSFQRWVDSFTLNSLSQLGFVHAVYDARRSDPSHTPSVFFFAGGGTNGAVASFSAYTSAKIHLIKMTELLAFENPSTRFCIVGPGWTMTKAHKEVLENVVPDHPKYREVADFLADSSKGTPLSDVFGCIEWLRAQTPKLVSGRNFSVRDDSWRGENTEILKKLLASSTHAYKLRRSNNSDVPLSLQP